MFPALRFLFDVARASDSALKARQSALSDCTRANLISLRLLKLSHLLRRTTPIRSPAHHAAANQIANMSAPSLAPFIRQRPWLNNFFKPLANWYANASGYRQLGLRYGHSPFSHPSRPN